MQRQELYEKALKEQEGRIQEMEQVYHSWKRKTACSLS